MRRGSIGRLVAAVLAGGIPAVASAEYGALPLRTDGFYATAGVGLSQFDADTAIFDLGGSDIALELGAGYRFRTRWLPWVSFVAVEGAYVDLGKDSVVANSTEFELEVDGIEIAVTGFVPFTQSLDVYGKLGVFSWDAELAANGAALDDTDGTDLLAGLGVAWNTGSPFGARLELDTYDILDGALTISVSGQYQFK